MAISDEVEFENGICAHLASHGPGAVSTAVTALIDVRGRQASIRALYSIVYRMI